MNFTDTLDIKGIVWKNGSKEGEISICCPFCADQGETEDTKSRLGINIIKNVGHCFNCEWSSRENTIQKVLKALEIESNEVETEKKEIKKVEFDGHLPESFEQLWPMKDDKDFRKAYRYARDRGVTTHQIKKYNIGFCLAGKYSNRVIFPVYDIEDNLKCYLGRDFTDKQELRWKISKGSKTLYGLKKKHCNSRIALLVEGAFDKLTAELVLKHQDIDCIGIPGRTLKDKDVEALKDYGQIIRVPDDDRPGLKGAVRDAKKLQEAGFDTYISFLDSFYEDINDAYRHKDFQKISDLYKNKQPFSYSLEMKIRTMLATDYRGARRL